ncbi:MAG TPA: YceI family protein [Vicinamibacterales bacterium]|nr:YceI family protein [Vicinamibacterales bacterium]
MRIALARRIGLSLAVAAGCAASAPPPSVQVFLLDPARSRVLVHVGKAGLFSFAGHTHEVAAPVRTGRVEYDPADPTRSTIVLEFDAAALRVTGRGEPAGDVPEVQRTMLGPRVLDAERFPSIRFQSRAIRLAGASTGEGGDRAQAPPGETGARRGRRLSLAVTGDLTLHGVTRSVSTQVDATVDSDELVAGGRLQIRQTDFGIRPVTAGAGTVRVKDALEIEFSLVARRAGE